MSEATTIEWCDATFNAWIGCTKVSPGCAQCYAEHDTRPRVLRAQGVETWGRGAPRQRTAEATWRMPERLARMVRSGEIRGAKPRVFCASLADWLDPEVATAWRVDLLALIFRTAAEIDWLLLTKRPERWRALMQAAHDACALSNPELGTLLADWLDGHEPEGIWIGCTVEDQARANARREALREMPAAVHFVSYEPALEGVDWMGWEFLDWLIMGGESGTAARACSVEWLEEARRWCEAHGVAPFVKQLGRRVLTHNANALSWPAGTVFADELDGGGFAATRVKLKHPKGGALAEFPEELAVRKFPTANGASETRGETRPHSH